MQRKPALLTLIALALLLWALPSADRAQLAAIESGTLLDEPWQAAPGDDWKNQLGRGDEIAWGADERGVIVSALESPESGWTVAVEGRQDQLVGASEVTALVKGRPLGQLLVPKPDAGGQATLTVRSFQLQSVVPVDSKLQREMLNSVVRHLRSHAAGLDSPIEFALVEAPDSADVHSVHIEASQSEGYLSLAWTRLDGTHLSANKVWHPPTPLSLLPPLVAIALAIVLRKPVPALFAGVLTGSILARAYGGDSWMLSSALGSLDVFRTHLWNEVVDGDRMRIVAFVVFMLAMVGVITRAGGIRGMMDRIARLASDARRSQIATWCMGLVIFFDDYANTILVGTTMRPLTDHFKVAREKLAYIVDSTAAPVAGVSILSTWIAFEVSTFSTQLPSAGLLAGDGYAVFLQTLPYRFYCLLTLFFVGLVTFTGRDFGPMLKAERRARGGQLLRKGAKPMVGEEATGLQAADHVQAKSSVAILPILLFVFATLAIILHDGGALKRWDEGTLFTLEGMTAVLYDGSGFDPLMWGSLAGFILALIMGFGAGLRISESAQAAWSSLSAMGIGLVILYLAWAIGTICGDLGTAGYLSAILSGNLNPVLLPSVLFALSGFVAFATGSSWSTMTILLPLVVGLAFRLGETADIGGHLMMVISIGAVLEGAIFGDHCSPISDTTVMSSIAAASDHIDHVRTQMPYSLLTMVVAMTVGYMPAAIWGFSPWYSLLIGALILTLALRFFGARADDSCSAAPV